MCSSPSSSDFLRITSGSPIRIGVRILSRRSISTPLSVRSSSPSGKTIDITFFFAFSAMDSSSFIDMMNVLIVMIFSVSLGKSTHFLPLYFCQLVSYYPYYIKSAHGTAILTKPLCPNHTKPTKQSLSSNTSQPLDFCTNFLNNRQIIDLVINTINYKYLSFKISTKAIKACLHPL